MKKVFLAILCIAITFVSCQKDEVQEPEIQNSEFDINKFPKNISDFQGKSINLKDVKVYERTSSIAQPPPCEECEITLKYISDPGGTAQIDIVDSNNNSVFSQVVTTGTTYTFTIDPCETYDITTQALTGGYGNVKINDDVTSYIIPASEGNPVTFVEYDFECIDDTAVEECSIELCIDTYSGSASGVYLLAYVNGGFSQWFGPLQNDDCITLNINENDTLEIVSYAINPTPDFGFFLRISTQTHNLSYPMPGQSSRTGIISNRFLQCLE